MAHDPALEHVAPPQGTLSLADITKDHEGVFVFDFDGVIIDRYEDDLYKLPSSVEENAQLQRIATQERLHIEPMSQGYRRHLIYQMAALRLNMPMVKGPAFGLYQSIAQQGRAFVLTARSGFYAVQRALSFMQEQRCPPVENFFVGRGGKNVALKSLREEYPHDPVYFVEDSAAHLARAARMKIDNLHLVHVTDSKPPRPPSELALHLRQTLARAFP